MKTILIDNGHGIETPGKRSPFNVKGKTLLEFEFNRDIARRLYYRLRDHNYNVVLLVPEIEDIPLSERVRRANTYDPKTTLLVSIHANAGRGTGYEIFTSPGQTNSDKCADIMYLHAQSALIEHGFPCRKDLADGDYDKEAKFYMLTKTKCSAVLTENLFMDTMEDFEFLTSEIGRQTIVGYHESAIKRILE